MKTATINIRIDPNTKREAESLFSSFGLTVSDAVNLFIHQSLLERAIPFQPKQPRYNAETEAAMQEARDISTGKVAAKRYATVDDMFADLDA